MKKILFLGAAEKTGILLNLMRVISLAGLKCLYIDGTTMESLSVNVPSIDPSIQVIDFEGFDCALKQDHISKHDLDGYDYVQVDIDNSSFINGVPFEEFDKIYIFTTQDRASLLRTKKLIDNLTTDRSEKAFPMTLILNNFVSTQMEDDFIFDFFNNSSILRADIVHIFNFDEVDYQRQVENGHDERANLRRFSRHYRRSLSRLTSDTELIDTKSIATAFKKARRG